MIYPFQRTNVETVEDSLALELSQFCFICIKHAQLQPISSNSNDHLLSTCPKILIQHLACIVIATLFVAIPGKQQDAQ